MTTMRYIKNLLLALATILTISSCVSEVDDVFDKSSSQRIEEAMAADKAILVNQPNGWLLKIYGDLDFGGYNLLLKFNDDNSLRVAGEVYYNPSNPTTYAVETSHYKLEQSSGVVLSFDEFSQNIHFFSDPANPAGMGTNSRGFWADLEFRVISASADSIVMVGKKHGDRLVMVPSPVAESEWQSYLDQVAAVEKDMSCANYMVKIGDETYSAKTSYRNLAITVPTDEGNQTIEIPYTVTPEGYSFYKTYEVNGVELSGFKYVENSLSYPETSGASASLEAIVPTLSEQLISSTWYATMSQLGEFGTPYWKAIQAQIMPILGEELTIFTLGMPYPSVAKVYGDVFCITTASYDGAGNYFSGYIFSNKIIDDNTITIAYSDNVVNDNSSAAWYIKNAYFHYLMVPFGCSTKLDANGKPIPVERTFKLSTDNIKSPSYIILTDVDNEKNVIKLYATQVTYPMRR